MPRQTLLDFFEDIETLDDTFLVHDDGYRVREITYRSLGAAAHRFADKLRLHGVEPGATVVIWSENRPEWVAALWGCLLAHAVLVPVDYRASADLLVRISSIVKSTLILIGDDVESPEAGQGAVWRLRDAITFPAAPEPDPPTAPDPPAAVSGASLAEIIFTSGATAEPKGVTITHRNVLANMIPIEREIGKYRRYVWPFHPLRFLNLLPLSHMFGQSMATFVPPMLRGTVVFSHGYSPTEIVRQIKSRRISVLVCVPKVLDVLRDHVERAIPLAAEADQLEGRHWIWRWWRYRAVHRLFGWKFWCVICGAAPLDPALEAFWRKLGFLVVQGYGLTETAPIVTLNHPLRASRGTVGTPIAGVEVRIAGDGEILVRGDNVTAGYYRPDATPSPPGDAAFEDGWFHTGDIGEMDESGRLRILGRKKEMIATAQGLNVFPEDVERALRAQDGVVDAGVVGVSIDSEERVHAVLVLQPGADRDAVVRGANQTLEDHQRVWGSSIWPGEALPRTEGTQKLKRRELQRWAAGESAGVAGPAVGTGHTVEDVVSRFAAGRSLSGATTLDEIGLSSLDRVEMMMALESAFQVTLDEAEMAKAATLDDLRALVGFGHATERRPATGSMDAAPGVARPQATDRAGQGEIVFPAWNRSRPAWLLRRVSLPTWILPLGRIFMKMQVEGLEHLNQLTGPVVFAANHQSHLDVPAILIALPSRWRYAVAPAMAKEFFLAHFNRQAFGWKAWFTNSLNYYLSCQFFNAFPLPQREAGTRQTLRYIGEIAADGYSIIIFPEGKRTQKGEIIQFRPGVGMMAARLGLPVVPVRLEGLEKVLHQKMKFPIRGPARVAFGQPLQLTGEDYPALARRVEQAVRDL